VAAVESLALCARVGVGSEQALEVFNASTGRSFATEITVPRAIVSGTYNLGFRMELMHKDVRLCLQESEVLGVPMWQGVTTGQLFNFAMSQGMAKDDFTAIGKMIAQWADVDLVAPTTSK
jgi:3-hydroxyisobutyrate dehydrogenase-like beta-hydroxyacid dehydrogenase